MNVFHQNIREKIKSHFIFTDTYIHGIKCTEYHIHDFIQLHRPLFLHIMYYMDCKEIFPSPFNPRIHLRYALFKNSSDLKLRIEIFSKFLNHSPSQLYIKKFSRRRMRTCDLPLQRRACYRCATGTCCSKREICIM